MNTIVGASTNMRFIIISTWKEFCCKQTYIVSHQNTVYAWGQTNMFNVFSAFQIHFYKYFEN